MNPRADHWRNKSFRAKSGSEGFPLFGFGETDLARLAGKVAVGTGASRGYGRAIAQRPARDGALVAVHYAAQDDAAKATVAAIERCAGGALHPAAPLGWAAH